MLILIDVQYSYEAVFSFEKHSNHQSNSSSGSLYPVKKIPPVKFSTPPPPTTGVTHNYYLKNPGEQQGQILPMK